MLKGFWKRKGDDLIVEVLGGLIVAAIVAGVVSIAGVAWLAITKAPKGTLSSAGAALIVSAIVAVGSAKARRAHRQSLERFNAKPPREAHVPDTSVTRVPNHTASAPLPEKPSDPVKSVVDFSGLTEDAVQLLRWAEADGVILVHQPTAAPIKEPRNTKWLKIGSQDLKDSNDSFVAKRWLGTLDILEDAGYVREKKENEYVLNGKARVLLDQLKDAIAGHNPMMKPPNFMKLWKDSDELDFYEYDLLLGLSTTDFCIATRASNGWFMLIGDNSKHWKDEPGSENGLKMKMVAQQLTDKGFLKPAYTPNGEKWELTPKGFEMSRVIGMLGPR